MVENRPDRDTEGGLTSVAAVTVLEPRRSVGRAIGTAWGFAPSGTFQDGRCNLAVWGTARKLVECS